MSSIYIAIADDYKIIRDGIILGLHADPNLKVIMQAENGQDLIAQLEHEQPHVIIMDLKMPVMDGLEATRIIRQRWPAIKVLVVTMYDDDKFMEHLLKNGANGYLVKNSEPAEIIKAIYSVYETGQYKNDRTNNPA